ncbi:kinase-like domain-containing protein [Suillus subalutaceus]|uniref:kinase-like domain-containing protein n=1 Tax=Suillus subalutaceus TaxID=48586 RepID=UPI001B872C3B|nr:kinase-like domain-containing protein [Suillus subalutaceus]KAG1842246.1 kinase-like domain-containing protein [Suillus subalutaceus]
MIDTAKSDSEGLAMENSASSMPSGSRETVAEGPVSLVSKSLLEHEGQTQWIAIKTSTIHRKYAKEPHDIIKEARLIASACHPNVVSILGHDIDSGLQTMSFWMPYVPSSLIALLSSNNFSPHPLISILAADPSSPSPREQRFVLLAKSLMYQILSGVTFLHETAKIAHRDIKPSNILLTLSGRVQLIDFGISWKEGEDLAAKKNDLWVETPEKMYFEVSTGPYRAPELLFGPRNYDAFAIDSWSLGATFAEFFTTLRLYNPLDDDDFEFEGDEQSDSGDESPSKLAEPFIIPKGLRIGDPTNRWARDSLFDSTRGEIGLAWSIFKIRGSPNETSWPSFLSLPDANKLSFINVEPIDLPSILPNFPSSAQRHEVDTKTHMPQETMSPTPVDLIHRFLVYEPSQRLRPSNALTHPWFTSEPPLLLPDDFPAPSIHGEASISFSWGTKSLGEWLLDVHPSGAV